MRPRRLYIEPDTKKPYYIINGKKKYVKVPKGVSMKQLQKVNIRNIINIPMARRIKRRRKKVVGKFQQKINNSMKELTVGGLPLYLFQEKKEVPELALAGREKKKETTILVPSSTTLITPKTPQFALPLTDEEKEQLLIKDKTRNAVSVDKIITQLKKINKDKPLDVSFKQLQDSYTGKKTLLIERFDEAKKIIKAIQEQEEQQKAAETPLPTEEGETVGGGSICPKPKVIDIKSEVKIGNLERKKSFLTGSIKMNMKLIESVRTTEEEKKILQGRIENNKEEIKNVDKEIKLLSGCGDEGDGLYNDEIETITKKRLKRFVPVIASDETEELMRYVSKGDKEFAFVINTNSSDSDGSGNDGHRPGHWTCVYFDNRDDYPSAEFYDPLAEGKPPQAVVNIMRKISRKMNPEKMFKYKQNLIRRQSRITSNCGQHCIKFIEDRMNGVPFCEASGYDDFIATHQGADNSEDGEKDLKKYIPIYKSYV
jgi:hypothetical protein